MAREKKTVYQLYLDAWLHHYSSLGADDQMRMATFKCREELTRLGVDIPKVENMELPLSRVNIAQEKKSDP